MRWTIEQRILGGFVVLLLLLLVSTAVSAWMMRTTADQLEHTVQVQGERLLLMHRQEADANEASNRYFRYVQRNDNAMIAEFRSYLERSRAAVVRLQSDAPTADIRRGWEEAAELLDRWGSRAQIVIDARREGRLNELSSVDPATGTFSLLAARERLVEGLGRAERAHVAGLTSIAVARAERGFWTVAGLALAALLTGIGFAWILGRSIGTLLRQSVAALSSTTADIAAATAQQASSSAEQAAAIQETARTVEEVKRTAADTAARIGSVAEAARRTEDVTETGRRAVADTVAGIGETSTRMEALAERILTLSEQAHAIAEITVTVGDIADQSNLLAVNASIEAAKAGEAGKGFGVVAGEIRSLADRSKHATAEIRRILSEIQRAVQAAVLAAEQGVKAAENGVDIANRAGEAIATLGASVRDAAEAAQQILASAQQQAAGIDQIAIAARDMSVTSLQAVSATRQIDGAATDLKGLTARIQAMVVGRAEPLPALSRGGAG